MSSTSPGVPGFETIDVLADGPSTIVRARSLDDGRDVIVKLLDPASEPILPKRFDRRRRALQRLCDSGQGFTPLLAHGVASDGRTYIVAPHLPLGSLQDQLDRGPTPWFPASQLMAKVAEAAGRAHEQEAPLGDLRPSKILLQGADTPLIAAFGMASRRFDDGRPNYRAPEADNDTAPTAPADVYSIALILATLIAGRHKERSEPVDAFLAELVGLAPARIHEVLEHGLSDSVTNRYGSGVGIYRALSRAIDEGPDQRSDDEEEVDSFPVDLDDLLPSPLPKPQALDVLTMARTTAEGLPADLGDLVLVGEEAEGHEPDEESEDHLLLPAGLDDIVLAPPSPIAGNVSTPAVTDDETIPFPLDDVPLALEPPAAADAMIIADSNDSDSDDSDSDDSNSDDVEGAEGHNDDGQEIVDLTELFTRTHEFVYDPEIHGPADRPTDDGGRSGEGQTPTQPPGDHSASPSPTTTLLRPPDSTSGSEIGIEHAAALDPASATNGVTLDGDIDLDPVGPNGLAADDGIPIEDTGALLAPAPPQMPARPSAPSIDDDQTDIFPGSDAVSPPWLSEDNDSAQVLDPDRSEAIPFPNMGRVRDRVDDHRWQARARTKAELLWFRGRRTFFSLVAVLGLAAIVAIVVLFAAREIRSATTSVDTEGVPQPLTTATTSVNFQSTDAPFVTDVPPQLPANDGDHGQKTGRDDDRGLDHHLPAGHPDGIDRTANHDRGVHRPTDLRHLDDRTNDHDRAETVDDRTDNDHPPWAKDDNGHHHQADHPDNGHQPTEDDRGPPDHRW